MVERLKRLWSLLRGPRPFALQATADAVLLKAMVCTVAASAVLKFPDPEGNGWLAPNGRFYSCEGQSHAKAASLLLGEASYDTRVDYEQRLESQGFAKLTETLGRWNGWHRATRLTRDQRDTITDWYLNRNRRLPIWLEELY